MRPDISTSPRTNLFIALERSSVTNKPSARGRGYRQGVSMLRGLGGLALILLAACAPAYVYIQAGKSEQDVRRDYIGCAAQQFKVSDNTTECMERQGYHVVAHEGASHTVATSRPGH